MKKEHRPPQVPELLDDGAAERSAIERSLVQESLGAFLARRATAMGDATVAQWIETGERLSYRELDERANRLANGLLKIGVRKGTHVAVILGNEPAYPITWMALALIGAVMVPVNSAYTPTENKFVLADSDAQFVVVAEQYLHNVPLADLGDQITAQRTIVCGVAEGYVSWERLVERGESTFLAPSPVAPNDLLNLQYTSGTTGFPKGCMLTHDYWMVLSHSAATLSNRTGDMKNVLIWSPFSYMDPQWQFLLAMHYGGTAFVAKKMSLSRFYDWLETFAIHYCTFPEAALKMREPSKRDQALSLKFVNIYGWGREARKTVQERFGVVAREAYGMTEIGIGTFVPLQAREKSMEVTCGVAGPFRELKIVDTDGSEVSQGEEGELWVEGRGLLWGYYKRPQSNAETFRGRWFRTGDIFRQDANGFYYIVGRIKDMIRRAGENVAAIEVEAALRAMDQISEAAVIPVPDDRRKEEVKAYVLLKPGLTPELCKPEDIIEHCAKRLAPFKVPRYLCYVTEFPRTPSNKIKKSDLLRAAGNIREAVWDRETGRWFRKPRTT